MKINVYNKILCLNLPFEKVFVESEIHYYAGFIKQHGKFENQFYILTEVK